MPIEIPLRITVLGSGTSTGVPTIGCNCATCKSSHPYDKRTRSSIMITRQDTGERIVIDTTPDFRAQMLEHCVTDLKYVLYTHTHADHCHGFDDLRAFTFYKRHAIHCYLRPDFQEEFRARFAYAFHETGYEGSLPQVELKDIPDGPFTVAGLTIHPIRLPHGSMTTSGFRFGSFAYITDFKTFPEEALLSWQRKVHTMIASGVRFRLHPSHSSVGETIALFAKLKVQKGIITHLSHEINYLRDSPNLPEQVFFAHDGMVIDLVTSTACP